MLTTDPIFKRPLVPRITVKNTANTSTLLTYDPFVDSGTTDQAIGCSVNLSQNHHGQFEVTFEDANHSLENTVTANSRVIIECGKQSSQFTRLISGLVKKKGYTRGANGKVLYSISGPSTGIRLNERVTYAVSEAAKLAQDGITIDITDASRKADTLLATTLTSLTADGVLSIANLAANSDVETFIASLAVEYGELQDAVNYIEEQSGGEVVVDINDLVNFRYELKNTLSGRGFTLKNSNAQAANDDADDTMYLRGRNWTYEDSFYKSDTYANRVYSILSAETEPSSIVDMGYNVPSGFGASFQDANITEIAQKFRPTHSHFLPGDIIVLASQVIGDSATGAIPFTPRFRICKDSGGLPLNASGIVANIDYMPEQFDRQSSATSVYRPLVVKNQIFFDSANVGINSFDLDTRLDYWLIASSVNNVSGAVGVVKELLWWTSPTVSGATSATAARGASTNANGGSPWTLTGGLLCLFKMPRRRSESFNIYDPKAVFNTQSGLTTGLYVDSTLSDVSANIKTREAMYRHLANQLYTMARPRTNFNFPRVMAPNIPPFPGDPIIISDTVLGFSTSGNQINTATCGDMTYSWDIGNYEAPTMLNLQCVSIPTRYR